MKENSLVKNIVFSFIKTFLGVAFPLVTFAYSSRILGVDGIGQVNFARNIITYFTMIAMLGVNYYGTREVARVRENRIKLSCFCHEMLAINFFMTCIAYILLFISILFIQTLQDYTLLLLVNSFSIILTTMGMDWLYQGLEKFEYIAKRTVFFQFIAFVYMIMTVKNQSDILNYSVVLMISSSGANVLNFISSYKYIDFNLFSHKYNISKHLKSILWLFVFAVSVQLYTVLDSTMLGFIKGDYAVGIYTVAIKTNKMTDTLITSLGVALIPRLSFFIEQKEKKKVKDLINKAYNCIFMFSIPCSFGLFVLAPYVIELFGGSGFKDAIITMRILTPIVVIIPFNVLTNIQIFIPMKKEKEVIISSSVAAVTNFVCNAILIPYFAENGAAVATVIAEGTSAMVCYIYLRKVFNVNTIFENYYQYWIAACPILLVGILSERYLNSSILKVFVIIYVSIVLYFSILKIMKNNYFNYIKNKIIFKKWRNKA